MGTLSEELKVNGVVVCNCKNRSFFVGLEVRGSNNHIRVLECTECGHQMAVPFQAMEGDWVRKIFKPLPPDEAKKLRECM